MGKRRRIWLVALFLSLAAGIAWLIINPPRSEPVYKGKQLSEWLEGYKSPQTTNLESWQQADDAVRHIGTNGIPALLKMLRANDSATWKRKFLDLAYRQHLIRFHHVTAWRQNWDAAIALGVLGDAAAPAVPELINLYEHPISAPSQRYTAMALGKIGPAARSAIPSLLHELNTSTEDEVKTFAIFALGGIHSDSDLVLPALIQCLGYEQSTAVQSQAVDSLGNFGPDAESAVPKLVELLQSPNKKISDSAAKALLRIDPKAAATAGVK